MAREFGMPPTVQDEQPAVLLDWLIAIHDVHVRHEQEASK